MPLTLTLDPTSEDATNVPFELVSDAAGATLIGQKYPAPIPQVSYASSIDTEGELPVSTRWPNRKISLTVQLTGGGSPVRPKVSLLEQKLAKIARQGGTLKKVWPDGGTVVFDLITFEGYEPLLGVEYYTSELAEITIELAAKPFGRGAPVTLADHVETTLPVLVFTETGIAGDVPALGRLIVDDDQGVDQQWVVWGMQRDTYDSAATAALFYEAEGRTPQSGAAAAFQAGASGGGNNTVEATLGVSYASVLSTQASGGGAHLSHFGSYRVFARVLGVLGQAGTVSVALEWALGDFRRYTRNAPATLPPLFGNSMRTLDLGIVTLPKVQLGAQRWEGRFLAKSDVSGDRIRIDCFYLVPTECSGQAQSVPNTPAPTVFSNRDSFDQTTGNATGKALPTGGTWVGAGSANDFTIDATNHLLQRTAVSDAAAPNTNMAAGRVITASTPSMTNVAVGLAVKDVTGAFPSSGIVARYTDINNFVAFVQYSRNFAVFKRVAGVQSIIGNLGSTAVATTGYTLAMTIGQSGAWTVTASGPAFGTIAASGSDPALATGGALAAGTAGILDQHNAATACTRTYDDFYAYVPPVDAAVFASQSIEWRHDGVLRKDSAGSFYQEPSSYEGDYLRIPPYGQEGKPVRFIVKGSRGIPDVSPDSGIDDISARLTATPRYLVVPD